MSHGTPGLGLIRRLVVCCQVGMLQIKDDDKSSPELQALIENEVKQLLKVSNR